MAEEFVDARAVVFIIGRNKKHGDKDTRQGGAEEELDVLPVFTIRGGGKTDDGQGTDLGCHEGETGHDPRNTTTTTEKVIGVAFFTTEDIGDDEEKDDGDRNDDKVECGQVTVSFPLLFLCGL